MLSSIIYGSLHCVLLFFWWIVVAIIHSFLCIMTELKSVDSFTTNTDYFFITCKIQSHNLFFKTFFLISQNSNITC
jgi:hypothetical protein